VYPTISDLINDLFGINFPLPIQTFGFFVAISFLAAAYTLSLELRRKEKTGLLTATTRQVWIGKPASGSELLFSTVIGFIIGFKLLYFAMNYSELVADPQGSLLSAKGNLWGGVLFAGISGWMKYREKDKQKKEKPELISETVHPSDLVSNFTMVAAVAGILGAKLFHNLEYPETFFKDPIGELLSFSGLTMYGGLIVGAAGVIWYGVKNKVPPLQLCDAAAPGLMLAYGIGRIGCHLSGDGDWGIVNTASQPASLGWLPDWAWSYNYPHNVINEGVPMPGCEGRHCFALEQGVFPTPFYESVACILLFFVLWYFRKRLSAPGLLFSFYLLLNGVERFLVEQIRVNAKYHLAGLNFTQAQLISLILVLLGLGGLFYFGKIRQKTNYAPHG